MNPQTTTQQRLDEIEHDLEVIMGMLRGSNSHLGLIARVESINDKLQAHIQDERRCPALEVVDAIKGTVEKPGLAEAVRELHKWKANVDRLSWLLISTTIISLINIALMIARDFIIRP